MGGLLLTILSLSYRIQEMVPSASRGKRSCQALYQEPHPECSPWVLKYPATFFPCKDANSNLQLHARVDGSLLWDLSSHQLNKSPTLFACRASTPQGPVLGCSGCTPWSGYHLGAFIWSHVLQQFPLPWEESCLAAG